LKNLLSINTKILGHNPLEYPRARQAFRLK
jgi:hypothetical protein